MAKLSWSRQSIFDIERLHRFLAPVNPDAAARAIDAIRGGVKTLALFPQSGRPVAEMGVEIRDWLIPFGSSGYVVRYRFDGAEVVILLVRHQRERL